VAVGRIHWPDLPAATRHAVEHHTGAVHTARTVPAGRNSAVAALLTTDAGQVFVKGLHRDHPRRWNQDMEAIINPHVTHLAPRLLWRVQDEWDLLGFQAITGRHADYRPGSPDLPLIARTAAQLSRIRCPDLPVKHAEHRWREYIPDPADLALLAGDQLLHTDYNPDNILITGNHAILIDWAWPTKGAGWIDPACLILRLLAHGHTTQSAETIVQANPAWRTAPPAGVTVFARACAAMWHDIATAGPADWTQAMTHAATHWASART
jgi:Phosphotransferase enzyme family